MTDTVEAPGAQDRVRGLPNVWTIAQAAAEAFHRGRTVPMETGGQ